MSCSPADQIALVTFDRVVTMRCALSSNRSCVDRCARRRHAGRRDGACRRRVCRHDGRRIGCRPIAADGVQRRPRHRELPRAPIACSTWARRSDVVVYPIATKGARPEFLEELASLTGGRLHEVGRNDDLSATFRAILDEFRHRYLVTYTPKDVPKDGWHKLEVRVNRSGARVKARPGYQGG